jgi:hypothetical protein
MPKRLEPKLKPRPGKGAALLFERKGKIAPGGRLYKIVAAI